MVEEKTQQKEKTTILDHAKETVSNLKKNANLDLMKPVIARLRKRVKEIQKLSQAVHTKIPIGRTHRWYTESPKMFICGLEASMNGSNVGIITYQVYKSEVGPDGQLRKKLFVTEKDVYDERTGEKKKIQVNARYKFEKVVEETIEYKRPIKTKEYKEDDTEI